MYYVSYKLMFCRTVCIRSKALESLESALAVRQKDRGYKVHPKWSGHSSRDGDLLLHSFEGNIVLCFDVCVGG